ncbi:DUF4432 family protein [Natronolimnobius baerhuensis]|uniref:DUF4432 domain-containing protein n=1 Tax=Natronolimnobius baerhuensis TaxID=253108 RepID=A0A202E4A9_9EURY|nr:DUF4432 family protein [Natronolimnobius baerhuensis]OVE83018.1 DUF4432 domain-containing protein [Natronolimnobius baerhuensis]
MSARRTAPRIDDAYTYHGIDAVLLENSQLRILVVPGKGGDILEFRDKQTDVDVLWHADHEWTPPDAGTIPEPESASWLDHYPGGWQLNLPIAGTVADDDLPYGLHGESALIPWSYTTNTTDDAVTLELQTDLLRYPFSLERTLTLSRGEAALEITERVTNEGGVDLEYIWQQHIALGQPLIGPGARLDVPTTMGQVAEYRPGHENARLKSGATFEWPEAPGTDGTMIDLRQFPPLDSTIHDVAYATDLEAGWFAVTNPDLDVGFCFTFPTDPFECLWYWQPFGGHAEAPYWNRNYNVGLEPTTAYPAGDVPAAQRDNGTMKTLRAGETLEASFVARTYHGVESVSAVDPDGTVHE